MKTFSSVIFFTVLLFLPGYLKAQNSKVLATDLPKISGYYKAHDLRPSNYYDLGDKGFIRRVKDKFQYFNNSFEKVWEKEFSLKSTVIWAHTICASPSFIYIYEEDVYKNRSFITQLDYAGNIVNSITYINAHKKKTWAVDKSLIIPENSKPSQPSVFCSDDGLYALIKGDEAKSMVYYLVNFDNTSLKANEVRVNAMTGEDDDNDLYYWNLKTYSSYIPDCDSIAMVKERNRSQLMNFFPYMFGMLDCKGKFRQLGDKGEAEAEGVGMASEYNPSLNELFTIRFITSKDNKKVIIERFGMNGKSLARKEYGLSEIEGLLKDDLPVWPQEPNTSVAFYDAMNGNYVWGTWARGFALIHFNKNLEIVKINTGKLHKTVSVLWATPNFLEIQPSSKITTPYVKEGIQFKKNAFDLMIERQGENTSDKRFTILSRKDHQVLIIDDEEKNTSEAVNVK